MKQGEIIRTGFTEAVHFSHPRWYQKDHVTVRGVLKWWNKQYYMYYMYLKQGNLRWENLS